MQSRAIFAAAAALLSSAALSAFACPEARAQSTSVFFTDFDGTSVGTFSSTQNFTTTDPGNLFGSNVAFFDGAKSQDRYAVTQSLDLSAGNAVVTFVLRYEGNSSAMGDSADVSQFEKHEDPADVILLQYSTDGGSNWTSVALYGHKNDTFRLGATDTVSLPSAAWQSSVLIRMFQSGSKSNNGNDQWAVDDFEVLVGTPEPGTWASFGLGAAGLAAWTVRRRARRRPLADAAARSPDARPAATPDEPLPG